jgi:hypothetical protein
MRVAVSEVGTFIDCVAGKARTLSAVAGRLLEEFVELCLAAGLSPGKLMGHVVDALHNQALKASATGRATVFPSQIVADSAEIPDECADVGDHPNRKQMRVLARDGVGGLWSVAKSGLAIVLGNTAIDLDYETHVESHEAPILTPARAEANLATPFQAVAQVMRGGVKRRDVIKVTPSFNDGGILSVKM